jgi:hypothetical protein
MAAVSQHNVCDYGHETDIAAAIDEPVTALY